MANTEPGNYVLRDDSANRVGNVQVGNDGRWTYQGQDGGSNRGSIGVSLPDRTVFNDDRGNRVAVRNQDGSVVYDDSGKQRVGMVNRE